MLGPLEALPERLTVALAWRAVVADRVRSGQAARVQTLAELQVRVERRSSVLRVIASDAADAPSTLLEITFSADERMGFRLTENGRTQVFTHDRVVRHPALSAVLRLIADEVDMAKPLSKALLPFLCRSLLVYVARMATPVPLPRWGRPLRDLRIERALKLLNADISKRWTVELLARAVGLSRPAFARQFMRVLGLSPIRYLTQRRMQVAAALLLDSDAALAEVASRVGYDSEFAFNRAFKRHYRMPPGEYRQRSASVAYTPIRMAA